MPLPNSHEHLRKMQEHDMEMTKTHAVDAVNRIAGAGQSYPNPGQAARELYLGEYLECQASNARRTILACEALRDSLNLATLNQPASRFTAVLKPLGV